MSDKEKLIEILMSKPYGHSTYKEMADYLISNGVTVQKWIPVSERLPDVAVVKKTRYGSHTESVRVLCVCKQESGKRMIKEGFCNVYANGYVRWKIPGTVDSVTHWREMPEPPKECE